MKVTVYLHTKESMISVKDKISNALGECSVILDGDKNCVCYLLHEYSGEYEDFRDRVVFASLDRTKVEEKKEELETAEKLKNQQVEKCIHCPSEEMTKRKLKNRKQEIENYCNEFEPAFDGNECWCNNMRFYDDECTYHIKEMRLE